MTPKMLGCSTYLMVALAIVIPVGAAWALVLEAALAVVGERSFGLSSLPAAWGISNLVALIYAGMAYANVVTGREQDSFPMVSRTLGFLAVPVTVLLVSAFVAITRGSWLAIVIGAVFLWLGGLRLGAWWGKWVGLTVWEQLQQQGVAPYRPLPEHHMVDARAMFTAPVQCDTVLPELEQVVRSQFGREIIFTTVMPEITPGSYGTSDEQCRDYIFDQLDHMGGVMLPPDALAALHRRDVCIFWTEAEERRRWFLVALLSPGQTGEQHGHNYQPLERSEPVWRTAPGPAQPLALPRDAPQDAQDLHLLAGVQAAQGQFQAAEASYRGALALDADNVFYHYDYANFLDDLERYAEAEEHYKRSLALYPFFDSALNNYALLLEKQGRPAEAEGHFLQALWVSPLYHEARRNLALHFGERRQFDRAEAEYRKLTRLDPTNPLHHAELASLLGFQLGRFEEAWEQLRIARSLGLPGQAHHQLEAICRKRLGDDPHRPEEQRRLQRARAEQRLQQHQQARREQLIGIITDMAAESRRQPRQTDEAVRKIRHPDIYGYMTAGMVAEKQGRLGEALAAFKLAQSRYVQVDDPVDALEATLLLGNLCARMNKFEEAVACYRQLHERLDGTESLTLGRLWYGEASLLKVRGDLHTAIALYSQALELFQRLGDKLRVGRVSLGLGEIYLVLNETDQAERYLRIAEENLPPEAVPDSVALLKMSQASVEHRRGAWFRAVELWLDVRDYYLNRGNALGAAYAEMNLGLACFREHFFYQGIHQFRAAVLHLEHARSNLHITEDRIDFAGNQSIIFEKFVTVLAASPQYKAEAFDYMERAKSRLLLDMLAGNLPAPPNVPADLQAQEQQLSNLLQHWTTPDELPGHGSEHPVTKDLELLFEALDHTYDSIAHYAPDYVSLRRANPIAFVQLRQLLAATADS